MKQKQLVLMIFIGVMGVSLLVFLLLFSKQTDDPAIVTDATEYRRSVYDPPIELTNFTLPASTGDDLSLSDLQGEWVLLFFGYTHCPDFCPFTLMEYRQIVEMLGEDAAQLQVVFVSVDGARDTPTALATYVERYNPNFIGLVGDDETLAQIQPDFGLFYERHEDQGEHYAVDHTTRSYLIDPQGRLRVSFSYGTDREIVAESIREMIIRG